MRTVYAHSVIDTQQCMTVVMYVSTCVANGQALEALPALAHILVSAHNSQRVVLKTRARSERLLAWVVVSSDRVAC
jgi:hypothetical protein